jgi:uncharacterized protein (DUF305 family)
MVAVLTGAAAPPPLRAQDLVSRDLPAIDQHVIGRLLVHQSGGIALADRAIPRLRDPRLKALAESIRSRQLDDQALLGRWYRGWFGKDLPPPWKPGALNLPGFVLDPQALDAAGDRDRAFVDQVVPHLRLGLMMALNAQVHTRRQELLSLEQRIVQRQSSEIRALESWADQRSAP